MQRKSNLPSLADAPWLNAKGLQKLLAAIAQAGGEARVAGGAVRNTLMGLDVADVDVATTLAPRDVMKVAKAQGFQVHPTGIDHGTVTVVAKGKPYEVTTLRRDIETDGRRAVVAFTSDWAEDAARRDFTINAMYCDAAGGLTDFNDGIGDLRKRRVRFVGKPSQRIAEDYLRILRFFRFHARFGRGAPDAVGLAACARLKAGLRKLSAERVRQEILKLLEAPGAVPTLIVMAETGILKLVVPYTEQWRDIQRLPQDGVLRLFVLAKQPLELKTALKLSNAEDQRLQRLADAPVVSPAFTTTEQRRLLYQVGVDAWRDAVALGLARSRVKKDSSDWAEMMALPERWAVPSFPIKGSDLKGIGIAPGPGMGKILQALEDWWLASDFKPGKDELLARARSLRDDRK